MKLISTPIKSGSTAITRVIFILGLLGLLVSGYLAYEYAYAPKIGCPVGGLGCDIVRASQYSKIFGISVPYFGILFYLMVIGVSIALTSLEHSKRVYQLRFLIGFSGLLASIYFTSLEAFVIHSYCFWCVLSAIIATGIFLLSWKGLPKKRDEN